MTKREIFFYVSVMILVTSLLFIVGNNIPVLASFRWFWAPIMIATSMLFHPNTFKFRGVYSCLIYGVIYVIVLPATIWSNILTPYVSATFNDFYYIFVIVIMSTILKSNNYINEWIKLAKIGLWFLVISGFMTIIATFFEPLAVRASYSDLQLELEGFENIYRLGFGTYGYMTALVAMFPLIIFLVKRKHQWISRQTSVFLIGFFYFVIFQSQIFANIITATITIIFALLGSQNFKRNIVVTIIVVIVFNSTSKVFWINSLTNIGESFEEGSLFKGKLNDVVRFIEIDKPDLDEEATTGVQLRAARYPMLISVFLKSPLFGDASTNYNATDAYIMNVGKHLYWMSRLAMWGIFGFLGYLFILRNIFKSIFKLFDPDFKFYYTLSLLSIITLGLLKELVLRETYLVLFIIIPGLYLAQKKLELNK
ncbi:MAG: hypothetical protein MI922_27575 [Bacteroidales bacterium]|nr:hypothetical protein [Bacteroidales bacterium]